MLSMSSLVSQSRFWIGQGIQRSLIQCQNYQTGRQCTLFQEPKSQFKCFQQCA